MGQGTYGKVFKAKHLKSGKKFAIKYIKNVFSDYLRAKTVVREVSLLRNFTAMKSPHHTNKIYDLKWHDSHDGQVSIFLVLDYAPVDMRKVMDDSDRTPICHLHARKAFYSFLCALNFIHSANVMHRDIKPSNLLIKDDFSVIVCDFGLSRTVPETASEVTRISKKKSAIQLIDERKMRRNLGRELSNHISTRWYRAPEVVILEK